MAITFDAVTSSQVSSASSLTYSHTIGSGDDRYLIVSAALEHNGTVPTITDVTYNGVSLTKAVGVLLSLNRCELWYMLEADLPAAGSYNVVVTLSGSLIGSMGSGAISLFDVDQTAPDATASNSASSQTTISTNITPLIADSWLVDCLGLGANNNPTVISGQTERYDRPLVTGGARASGSTEEDVAASSQSMGWTFSNTNRAVHTIVALAPAGGAPAPTFVPRMMSF